MKAARKRLSILTQSEIQNYFGIPRLTPEDKEYFFELTDNELHLIDENWRLNSKLYFVLQLGYFEAKLNKSFGVHFFQPTSTSMNTAYIEI